jgi:tetratricopeptide (TPR) repeat protein
MLKESMKNLLFASLLLVLFNVAAFAQQPANPVASPTPQGARRPPQAKTHAEFNDYNTAYAITGGAAMEKAADDFAAKYPTSELRPFLYSKAMHEYQTENNPPKILAMGDKVLSLDPDNTVALVMTATVLSDMLSDPAQANDQKVADIRKNAGRALQTIDSSFVAPAGATADQIASYKNMLQAMAHSALGITDLKLGDDAGAEKELRTAADLGKAQPDAYVWYHLALAQDHQKKYTEALASIDQALKYVQPTADLAKLAAGERTRLQTLTGTAPSGQQPPANSSQPPL